MIVTNEAFRSIPDEALRAKGRRTRENAPKFLKGWHNANDNRDQNLFLISYISDAKLGTCSRVAKLFGGIGD